MKFGTHIIVILFVACLAECASCKKSVSNSALKPCASSSVGAIYGIAYYKSFYTGDNTLIALDSAAVYIKLASDTSFNPIFSAYTDSFGHFSFGGLDTCQTYTIFSHLFITSSSSFSAPYYGEFTLTPKFPSDSVDTIKIIDSLWVGSHNGITYTGINLFTQDITGGRISGTKVILYNSDTAAFLDTLSLSGAGGYTATTTDENGKALILFPQQTPNNYTMYANARIKIDSAYLFSYDNVVNINPGHIVFDTQLLRR